jgi:hypothetical protein
MLVFPSLKRFPWRLAMDLTKLLRNNGTASDCEISFVILSALGLLCIVILYLACLFEGNVPKGLFLVAIEY